MTECEICGVEIKGEAQYIRVESSKLQVCKTCARHGRVMVKGAKATLGGEPVQFVKAKRRLYEQMDPLIEEGMEIVEGYGRKIKEAREKAGLKQVELARRINEKESMVRRIENEEITLNKEVWRKIKRVFKSIL